MTTNYTKGTNKDCFWNCLLSFHAEERLRYGSQRLAEHEIFAGHCFDFCFE